MPCIVLYLGLVCYSILHLWLVVGYEVVGFDNIPNDGPALLVYYHGAVPIDYYYMLAKIILNKKRLVRTIGDEFLQKVPGKFTKFT